MYVSSTAASSATAEAAGASRSDKRQVSKTRAAVEQQLAHNRELSKSNAAKLEKYSTSTASAAQSAASDTAKTANTTSTTAAAGTAAAASTKATTTGSAGTTTSSSTAKPSDRHSSIYAKQHALNLAQAKVNASLLSKVASTDSSSSTGSSSSSTAANAAQAATSKYMANDGSNTKTSTTLFHA